MESIKVEKSSHTFIEMLKYEPKRYAQKGVVGIGFNLLFWPFLLIFCRDLLHEHWDWYLGLASWPVLYSVSLCLINVGVTLVYNLVMWPIYTGKITWFEEYRILDKEWHWEADLKEFKRMLNDTWVRMAFNGLILSPIFLYIGAHYTKVRRGRDDFDSFLDMFLQIWFLQAMESTAHGFFHNILHHPLFYDRCHKMHHEYTNVISPAGQYFGVTEFIFASLVPVVFGSFLLGSRLHYATYLLFMVWRICRTYDSHVGYEFPWSPFSIFPFCASSEYHNFHHSHNVSNYQSSYVLFDSILGRNKPYWEYLKRKQIWKKMQALQKVKAKSQ